MENQKVKYLLTPPIHVPSMISIHEESDKDDDGNSSDDAFEDACDTKECMSKEMIDAFEDACAAEDCKDATSTWEVIDEQYMYSNPLDLSSVPPFPDSLEEAKQQLLRSVTKNWKAFANIFYGGADAFARWLKRTTGLFQPSGSVADIVATTMTGAGLSIGLSYIFRYPVQHIEQEIKSRLVKNTPIFMMPILEFIKTVQEDIKNGSVIIGKNFFGGAVQTVEGKARAAYMAQFDIKKPVNSVVFFLSRFILSTFIQWFKEFYSPGPWRPSTFDNLTQLNRHGSLSFLDSNFWRMFTLSLGWVLVQWFQGHRARLNERRRHQKEKRSRELWKKIRE